MRTHIIICLSLFFTFSFLQAQQVEHLGSQINSEYDEREPILSQDGKTLYFWRREMPGNTAGVNDPGDIWYSRRLGENYWTKAMRLPGPANDRGQNFVWQVSPQHDTLWVAQVPAGTQNPGIAYSTKSLSGTWRAPQTLNVRHLTSKGNCKDYFLTPDRILLLPNEGELTYGESDLYVCFPLNDTAWSEPINLGPMVNSPGDEDAPFLSPDGRTLYFNSNGHGGLGDHDVFYSHRLDDTWKNWSEPKNLGAPVNTPGYDFDFRLSPDGEYAYWGSEHNTFGQGDIYRLNLQSCKLNIFPEGDFTLCEGQEITLEAGYTVGNRIRYFWMKDGSLLPGENARHLVVREPGDYRLLRIKDTCVDTSQVTTIRFKPMPAISINAPTDMMCLEDSVRLRANALSGYQYRWFKNGIMLEGEEDFTYIAKTPGTYAVGIYNNRCNRLSEPVVLKRLKTPDLFLPSDTLPGSPFIMPKWVWSNKLKLKKGNYFTRELVTDTEGGTYLMNMKAERNGSYTEYITHFFPQGPVKFQFPGRKSTSLGNRFMAVDRENHLVVIRNDGYLAKYRQDGRVAWQIPDYMEEVCGVATDPNNYIYTMGRFKEPLKIGDQVIQPMSRGNYFLAKHAPNGSLIWVQTIIADEGKHRFGNSIHTDGLGNVYVAGSFRNIANFRKKILRTSLRGNNYFMAKYDTHGTFQWANRIVVDKVSFSTQDVHVAENGDSFLLVDYKLLKFNTHGENVLEERLRAPESPRAARIVSRRGDIFIAGITQSKNEFFFSKLDRRGKQVLIWREIGMNKAREDHPAITTDSYGNLYVAGTIDKGVPPGTFLAQRNASPLMVAKYGLSKSSLKRTPISICQGDSTLLLTQAEPGLNYQWMRDGVPLAGANAPVYRAYEGGEYQVAIQAGACTRLSPTQRVNLDCGDEAQIPVPSRPTPAPEPAVVQAPSTPTPPKKAKDLRTNAQGKPQILKDRKISRQGDVVISHPRVQIHVWDHEVFDQDTISLNINGEWVLREYCLQKEKKIMEFTFDPSSEYNFIILYAHNLGKMPPNTASITIDDGTRKRTMRLRSDMKNNGMLNIQFE